MSEEHSEERVNSVLKKLLAARGHIKQSKVKKKGKNRYSDYEYFTPDQVALLVDEACQKVGIVSIFSLEKDDTGYYGKLMTADVDTGDTIVSVMRTEIPEIKATNATQKMGGAYTYTKRYMLMNEYDIADNNLDFDSQDNRTSKDKERDDAKPTGLRKPKLVKPEPAKPKEEEATEQQETSEIDILRAKCDELGIKYTGRHKESGLKKLIEEHNQPENTPYEAGEYVDDVAEEVEVEDSTDEVNEMATIAYVEKINSINDSGILATEAKAIVKEASEIPLDAETIEYIKKEANNRYKSLKAEGK